MPTRRHHHQYFLGADASFFLRHGERVDPRRALRIGLRSVPGKYSAELSNLSWTIRQSPHACSQLRSLGAGGDAGQIDVPLLDGHHPLLPLVR
uniref:Uncharacterized protein n=1 Tax=Streptomyces sp. F12 TaxID=1436084 RepID=V9Z6X9_9ACTN|nr:hypothetical protein pFRL6_205c [Streptomyces sp. F12]